MTENDIVKKYEHIARGELRKFFSKRRGSLRPDDLYPVALWGIVKAYRHKKKQSPQSPLDDIEGLIVVTIRNCLIDFKRLDEWSTRADSRSKNNRHMESIDDHNLVCKKMLPDAVIIKKNQIDKIRQSIEVLSATRPDQADRIKQHFLDGRNLADIAALEGVSDAAICMSIRHGLSSIRRHIQAQSVRSCA